MISSLLYFPCRPGPKVRALHGAVVSWLVARVVPTIQPKPSVRDLFAELRHPDQRSFS